MTKLTAPSVSSYKKPKPIPLPPSYFDKVVLDIVRYGEREMRDHPLAVEPDGVSPYFISTQAGLRFKNNPPPDWQLEIDDALTRLLERRVLKVTQVAFSGRPYVIEIVKPKRKWGLDVAP